MNEFDGPVVEFSHGPGHCSVTGGYMYRGSAFPELNGKYFYADYCSGQFWSLEQNDADEWVDFQVTGQEGFGWTSFGEDFLGELYLAQQTQGKIYRLIQEGCSANSVSLTQDAGVLFASQAMGYQWYLNGEAIPFATDQSYQPTEPGLYTVLAGFGDGCSDFSESIFIVISSLEEFENIHGLWLMGNPIQNELTIRFDRELQEQASMTIYDVMGREVYSGQVSSGVTTWTEDVSVLSNGNYTLSLSDSRGLSAIQFNVTR